MKVRKGEEFRAPRHASAAASCDDHVTTYDIIPNTTSFYYLTTTLLLLHYYRTTIEFIQLPYSDVKLPLYNNRVI